MQKTVFVSLVTVLAAAAACTTTSETTKPKTPAWSAFYATPFDAMTMCLAAPAGDGFVVDLQPSNLPGQARVLFVPKSAAMAESSYQITRRADGTTQVDWQRLGNVGGLDWLDVQARQRADRCGGVAG